MMSSEEFLVVGLGEALFDVFDRRKRLGGAPLNVAVQAHQLLRERGGAGVVVSRVGDDDLGREIRDELKQRTMTDRYLQVDPQRPTGTVQVTLQEGEPSYEIVRDVAWDALELDAATRELATRCSAVCYGTLAQRAERSRHCIGRFVERATGAIRLFDVNLRQDFYGAEVIRRSCELASVVKLNEGELPEVVRLLGLDDGESTARKASEEHLDAQVEILRKQFQLDAVALTRGARAPRGIPPAGEQPDRASTTTGTATPTASGPATPAVPG